MYRSCHRIITSNPPGHGDNHGCPFRHFSADNLQNFLHHLGIVDGDKMAEKSGAMKEVLDLAKSGHYQIACTRYFEMKTPSVGKRVLRLGKEIGANTAPVEPGKKAPGTAGATGGQAETIDLISSPNQYYDLRRSKITAN